MSACDSCGAALRPGATTCDLCGTAVGPADLGDDVGAPAMTCAACGSHPPAGSSFCNVCGAPVEAAPRTPEAVASNREPRASSAAGRRALVVAGLGAVAVGLLWGVTVLSDDPAPDLDPPDTSEVGAAAPIPDATPPLADSLQIAADEFAALDTAEGWYESGRYYLTAAVLSAQTDPIASVQWSRRAVADFERSLAIEDVPRVRVALAEAAAIDPADPMRPVQELNAALEAEPDNVDALVMLGERRQMIGRIEPAREAYERVLELAPPGSFARQRAEQGLAAIGQP